jgi:glycosyltransferase involved in cell wall biosynthesis
VQKLTTCSHQTSAKQILHGQHARDTAGRLRVLFSLPGLHRVNRGAEVAFEEVASRLAGASDFDVTLFGSGGTRAGQPYRYHKLRGISRRFFRHFPRLPYVRDDYAWEELAFAPSLYLNYSPAHYDLTVTCGYPYSNWILRRGRDGARRPAHIFVTQNGDWMAQARNAEFKHFSCDGLICTNPQYYERHRDRYRCALIPNGVDTATFRPGPADRAALGLHERSPVVLIVGALMPNKRVLDGISAVAQLPDVQLVVAGDGQQRRAVDDLGRQLLGERFRRVSLPRERMPELYRAADVLLHMAQDEAFGNIYVEALASGLPVVAHDTPATRWILQDQGHFADTSDKMSVVVALRAALDGGRNEGRVAARRALAEARFDWAIVARQYGEFFQDVYRHTH